MRRCPGHVSKIFLSSASPHTLAIGSGQTAHLFSMSVLFNASVCWRSPAPRVTPLRDTSCNTMPLRTASPIRYTFCRPPASAMMAMPADPRAMRPTTSRSWGNSAGYLVPVAPVPAARACAFSIPRPTSSPGSEARSLWGREAGCTSLPGGRTNRTAMPIAINPDSTAPMRRQRTTAVPGEESRTAVAGPRFKLLRTAPPRSP